MPYLVLALGLSMSVIGIGAVAFGYPIVQVERGWTTVIAGSTMLAGGLVTIAIGLVFQAVLDLKSAILRSAHDGGVVLASAPSSTASEPQMGMAAEAPRLTPAMVPAAPPFAAILDPEERPAAVHADETPYAVHEPVFEMPVDEVPVHPAPHEPETVAHEATGLTIEPEHYELGTPSTPEHDLVPVAPVEAAKHPADDDWLDRAFSDLDHELSGGPKDTHPAPVHESLAHEPYVHQDATHEPAVHDEPVHPDHAADVALAERPAEHASAVIGRYESDGTSYVMYADGSIEAQSEAGLYRFASMAELKAFIEG